ncbi:hypothetical protein FSARC_1974 [Fusarium sarcochroum]|uniref:AB hydrolase-1 domain-containing protein n=1 Tax=Fusarium sarcochroum TaxID=1208366 RepID=A0A8H4U7E5_9HYPO|nr:hypothetical protein FSARC_1974 [Fusarium sarcochroum]
MDDIEHIELDTKPGAKIAYRFQSTQGSIKTPMLMVFVNGLGLPQAGWTPAIEKFIALRTAANQPVPAILTYDRYGQGQTIDRDPQDAKAEDPMHGHDCLDVVRDLRQLLTQIAATKLGVAVVEQVALVMVCNSIGGALVRLYAQEYPATVAAILFLDSVLANTDFVSILPDPDAPEFSAADLPENVTVEVLRQSREGIRRIFHPSVGSREGLSRKNLRSLLPHSDQPKLQAPDGKGPWISVLGHEFDTFAAESAKMGQPEVLTQKYTNPFWETYNKGLARLTDEGRRRGPFQAPKCGHFIQKDNPHLVAEELAQLVAETVDS